MKIAFYPCCAYDFEEPVKILSNYDIDKIIFCDIQPRVIHRWRAEKTKLKDKYGIETEVIIGDASKVIQTLPEISILFYKRDSQGEGGSGLYVLGDDFLIPLMGKFPTHGGLILTDGSNSTNQNFEHMISESGLTKFGKRFKKNNFQSFIEYEKYKLWIIEVEKA